MSSHNVRIGDNRARVTSEKVGGARVMLWTLPRSSSTVFSRSISQVPGVEMWMEPYGYAHLAELNARMYEGVELPRDYHGNEAIYEKVTQHISATMRRMFYPPRLSYSYIKKNIEASTAKHVFVKDMAYGMLGEDATRYLPEGFRQSFLIRHPDLMFAGVHQMYYKLFKTLNRLLPGETDSASFDVRNHNELGMHEDFYKNMRDLWANMREVDPAVVVLDSTDLLANPEEMLRRYCEAVGLPFSQSLLSWKIDIKDIAAWNWGSDWENQSHDTFHKSLLSSTCFQPPKTPPPRDQLTDDVIELADEAMPYYEEMYRNRLQIKNI